MLLRLPLEAFFDEGSTPSRCCFSMRIHKRLYSHPHEHLLVHISSCLMTGLPSFHTNADEPHRSTLVIAVDHDLLNLTIPSKLSGDVGLCRGIVHI
jgi:hypothetical protein